jgi:hypothetical protein
MKLPPVDCGQAVALGPEAGYLVTIAGRAHIDDRPARRLWLAKRKAIGATRYPQAINFT